MSPAAHNAAVPIQLLVRAGVLLACLAVAIVSLTVRDSKIAGEDAIRHYFETRDARGTLRLIDESKRLNPDFRLRIAEARLSLNGVQILRDALRREPENAELWLRLAQQQALRHDTA